MEVSHRYPLCLQIATRKPLSPTKNPLDYEAQSMGTGTPVVSRYFHVACISMGTGTPVISRYFHVACISMGTGTPVISRYFHVACISMGTGTRILLRPGESWDIYQGLHIKKI